MGSVASVYHLTRNPHQLNPTTPAPTGVFIGENASRRTPLTIGYKITLLPGGGCVILHIDLHPIHPASCAFLPKTLLETVTVTKSGRLSVRHSQKNRTGRKGARPGLTVRLLLAWKVAPYAAGGPVRAMVATGASSFAASTSRAAWSNRAAAMSCASRAIRAARSRFPSASVR